jgi:hypothetical protein
MAPALGDRLIKRILAVGELLDFLQEMDIKRQMAVKAVRMEFFIVGIY